MNFLEYVSDTRDIDVGDESSDNEMELLNEPAYQYSDLVLKNILIEQRILTSLVR
jgi:hypothetical protein